MTITLKYLFNPDAHALKILWTTDLHLDSAPEVEQARFVEEILLIDPDVILVGGDISNGYQSLRYLKNLWEQLQRPVYFVFGNHDFYDGSVVMNRMLAKTFSATMPQIKYLTDGGIVELTSQTALIGHDGWADGRAGDFMHSTIQLKDYALIEELKDMRPSERLKKLHTLGTEAAEYLEGALLQALKSYHRILLLTHVPPFRDACRWQGHVTDDNWAPHFVGLATGLVLARIMKDHPDHELLVFCGHTHQAADVQILKNLRVITGASQYGGPLIQGVVFTD